MLTKTTANGKTTTLDHCDKWFQTFDSPTNNILSGDYAATGGTGRQRFWIDKETLKAYIPNTVSHE